jgi:hypothetical protein
MRFHKGVVCAVVFVIAGCGSKQGASSKLKERWDTANDPIHMLPSDYVYTLSSLPLEGAVETKPWSDSYWPSVAGGLAARWQQGISGHQVTPIPTSQALALTPGQLSLLSPAEKFDIFVGDEAMSLFQSERRRTHPTDESWFGICHGWAPAALLFAEPKAVVVTGPSGIAVPFGASDVKALLSLYTGQFAQVGTKFLASRCNVDIANNPQAAMSPECRDTNAGAFHLVLTNLLGIKKQGFVADLTRDRAVWNQPVSGFRSTIISDQLGRSPGAAIRTVREVVVQTQMFYGVEIQAQWNSGVAMIQGKTYNYRLEIGLLGEIVGGEWLDAERPDFLWSKSLPEFVDSAPESHAGQIHWSQLKTIYDAAVAAQLDAPRP